MPKTIRIKRILSHNDYRENENLDMVYDFLEKLGYEMSDDERALKDGTHPLFTEREKSEV